jgi:hypothetical protein
VNRLSLNLGLVAMEVCWLAPWAVLLGLWTDASLFRQLLSPASIVALVLLGSLSTQALGRRAASNRGMRLGLVGLGVLVTLVAVRLDQYSASGGLEWLGLLVAALAVVFGHVSAPALAFGLGLFLWWRGVRLGIQTASYSDVESAFRWGIGLLLSFAVIMAGSTRPSLLPALEAQTTPFIVGFFFFSLLTLAMARLESLRTRTRALAVNSQWLGALIIVAGAVVLLALVVGQLLSFELLTVAARPLFDLLGQVILLLIYLVVIPLAYILQLLIYFILSLVTFDPNREPPQPIQAADFDNLLQRFLSEGVSPELLAVLKAAGAALVLGVALLLIARAAARWRSTSTEVDAVAEERDSLWAPGRLKCALIDWLRGLFRRGSTVAASQSNHAPTSARGAATAAGVASVRQLYRQLLGLGESAGARRLSITTPLEHLPSLQHSLEPEENIARLTAAYNEVRYAEHDASAAEVASLQDQLEHVHQRDAPG